MRGTSSAKAAALGLAVKRELVMTLAISSSRGCTQCPERMAHRVLSKARGC